MRVDLAARLAIVSEAVVGRDRIGETAIDIEPQQRGQQRGTVLPVALGVVAGAAVADAREQHPVAVEGEHAALVHRAERRDDQQRTLAVLDGSVAPDGELTDGRGAVAIPAGIEHEEPAVLAVLGMEGEAEQPALVVVQDPIADVEEGRQLDAPVGGQLPDQASLLDDVAVAEPSPAPLRKTGDSSPEATVESSTLSSSGPFVSASPPRPCVTRRTRDACQPEDDDGDVDDDPGTDVPPLVRGHSPVSASPASATTDGSTVRTSSTRGSSKPSLSESTSPLCVQ